MPNIISTCIVLKKLGIVLYIEINNLRKKADTFKRTTKISLPSCNNVQGCLHLEIHVHALTDCVDK